MHAVAQPVAAAVQKRDRVADQSLSPMCQAAPYNEEVMDVRPPGRHQEVGDSNQIL